MYSSEGTKVLAISRTCALAAKFKQFIAFQAGETLPIDTLCYEHVGSGNIGVIGYRSIFVEVDRIESITKSLDIVEALRANTMASTIFILLPGNGTYNKTKYYLAGADYCFKVTAGGERELAELSQLISSPASLTDSSLLLDPTRMCIIGGPETLEISFTEMKIIEALALSKNHILSHDEIASVMGLNLSFYDPRALEKSISRLRGKIKTCFTVNALQSVRGYGYRLTRGLISTV